MSESLRQRLDDVQGKSLAMSYASGEPRGKRLSEEQQRRVLGLVIERAIVLSGREKKAVASECGYEGQSEIGKWVGGLTTAQFHKLWAIEWLQPFIVIALAEAAGGLRVQTTVTLERRRA